MKMVKLKNYLKKVGFYLRKAPVIYAILIMQCWYIKPTDNKKKSVWYIKPTDNIHKFILN